MHKETVKLEFPYKDLENVDQFQVEIRTKVTVGDWRAASKQSKDLEERIFHMVMRCSGLDVKEIEQLTLSDYQKLADKLDMGDTDPKA